MNISKLRKLMSTRKVTQKEMAEKVGVSVTTINESLKRGDFKVSILEAIAEVLQVPVSYFFDDKEEITLNNGLNNVANDNTNSTVTINDKTYNVKVLMERIKGLEAQLEAKNETIEILKNK